MYRRLDHLVTLSALAETGSFARAAGKLGLPPSTVTAHIAALEDNLGLQLVVRTTRKNRLTDQGARLAADAQRMVAVVNEAMARIESGKSEPVGQLRVSVPFTFAADLLGPVIGRFATRYPGISVELVITNSVADLIADGLDLAIRIGQLADSSLIRRKLVSIPLMLVASRGYLEAEGRPRIFTDLINHTMIGFQPRLMLTMQGPGGVCTETFACRIAANDPKTIAAIMGEGGGITVLPRFLVEEGLKNGNLEIVLPDHTHASADISAVHYGHSTNNPRIELFTSFLAAELVGLEMR